MSLYRQAGRTSGRTLAIVAVVALVVGLGAGYALGRSTAPKPTLADKVADLRSQLGPAAEGIELTATEYGQGVRGGQVVAPTEYQAAKADVQRVADTIAGARADLRALNAARAAALDRTVAALATAVDRRSDPAEVMRLTGDARTALDAVLGRS